MTMSVAEMLPAGSRKVNQDPSLNMDSVLGIDTVSNVVGVFFEYLHQCLQTCCLA